MHQFDWLPQCYDIDKMCYLLGVEDKRLVSLTFNPVLNKFVSNLGLEVRDFQNLRRELVLDRRKFCPICINSNKVFKLIWQVSELEICNEHLVVLESNCVQCGNKFNYVTKDMVTLKCSSCQSSICKKAKEVNDLNYIKEQQRKYEDWKYLMENKGIINMNIPGLNNEQSLACLILYTSLKDVNTSVFNQRNIRFFNLDRIKRFASLIRNRQSFSRVKLQDILKVSRALELNLREYFKIRVPETFVKSFFSSEQTGDSNIGVCKSPWCEFFETNKGIKELNGTFAGVRKSIMKDGVKYKKVFACSRCFMRYAIHPETKQWNEIDDRIYNLWHIIRPLFNSGYTRTQVAKKIGITVQRSGEYLGYMVQQQLLNKDLCRTHTPKHVPSNLVEIFRELGGTYFSSYVTIYKKAKRVYGWTWMEFCYYSADKDVNYDKLFIQSVKVINKSKQKEKLEAKIKQAIEDLSTNDKLKLSIIAVADLAGCSDTTIYDKGLSGKIHTLFAQQKRSRLEVEQGELERKFCVYKKQMDEEEMPLLSQHVFRYLGRSQKYITQNFPLFAKRISEEVLENKRKHQKAYLKRKELEVKKAVHYVHQTQGKLNLIRVSSYLGINYYGLQGNAKKIREIIQVEINRYLEAHK